MNTEIVLDLIAILESRFEELAPWTVRHLFSTELAVRKGRQISGRHLFTMALPAYSSKANGTCSVCGHAKEGNSPDEREMMTE